MPRAIWWSYGGLLFLMSEVPLYSTVWVLLSCADVEEALSERFLLSGKLRFTT